MPLHAVRAADDQNDVVQHLERALHLRRKIHMARRIQKGNIHLFCMQDRLLGKDGDAPLPLQLIRVQIGISVIHPAQSADITALVEERLRERCLSRVHMSHQAQTYKF